MTKQLKHKINKPKRANHYAIVLFQQGGFCDFNCYKVCVGVLKYGQPLQDFRSLIGNLHFILKIAFESVVT